jgi:predicted RNase H-like HicB family nuclease
MMDYIAYLHKDRKSDSGVSFPDFPGSIPGRKNSRGGPPDGRGAWSLHISGMMKDGDAIPEPSPLDDLAGDPDMKAAVAFLVAANLERTAHINVTAKESLRLKKLIAWRTALA